MTPDAILARLQRAAADADAAEEAFRRDVARRLDALARERTFAYRRFNLVREMLAYAQAVEEPEAAMGAALAAVRRELSWDEDTPIRAAILTRLEPVARHAAALAHPEPTDGDAAPGEGDLLAALADFERCHESEYGASFWSLFDVYVPEPARCRLLRRLTISTAGSRTL